MSKLRLIPLGGMGNVTQNMYAYEYDQEILLVDCGIGFPDLHMPGVDVLIPDTTWLHQQLDAGKTIVGMVLTHGHDDHIAALPYILPELPDFPIFASPLTAGFAANRVEESPAANREFTVVSDNHIITVSQNFQIEAIPMTHSVPDTRHYAIHTPVGVMYHGSDFKIDLEPVDGVRPDFDTMTRLGKEGVVCMLIDCLRVEREYWTKSESAVRPELETAMSHVAGKVVVTLMSSHIHRIQQVVDVAQALERKLVFIGRSVEQNVEVAMKLKKLHVPREMIVDKRDFQQHHDQDLVFVVAGSQGQEGSSLVRAVYGDHPQLQITSRDRVIFSSDVIPGNEIPYYAAIDELARNGIEVMYPDVMPNLHQSGHASAMEQQLALTLVKPQLVMPIGGQDRHRVKFHELVAAKMGYQDNQVILPAMGEIIAFDGRGWQIDEQIEIRPRIVDGLGIGDVGRVVLADRRVLGQDGMIVLVIPRQPGDKGFDLRHIEVESRGFVFMKEAEDVISFIKESVAEIITQAHTNSEEELKRQIERKLTKKVQKVIRRSPMVVPMFVG